MSLSSPKKINAPSTITPLPLDPFTDERLNDEASLVVAKHPGPQQDSVEEYRTRFVGEVDLDEKDEPLLKASSRRFVLFPIQYHEVRASFIPARRVFLSCFTNPTRVSRHQNRYGKCTRRQRRASGLPRRWTFRRISMTGKTASTTMSATSSPMSLLSLPRLMVLLMRTSSRGSAVKSKRPRRVASTVFRS